MCNTCAIMLWHCGSGTYSQIWPDSHVLFNKGEATYESQTQYGLSSGLFNKAAYQNKGL